MTVPVQTNGPIIGTVRGSVDTPVTVIAPGIMPPPAAPVVAPVPPVVTPPVEGAPVVPPVPPVVGQPDPNSLESLPEFWQKEVRSLRDEAAAKRVALKDATEKLAGAKSPEEFAKVQQDFARDILLAEAKVVLYENELPLGALAYLKGSTREELVASAQGLKTLFNVSPQTPASPVTTPAPALPGIPNPLPDNLTGGLTPGGGSTEKYDPAALAEQISKANRGYIRR